MTYFSAKTFILSPRSLSISSIRGPKHKPWVEQGALLLGTNTWGTSTFVFYKTFDKHVMQLASTGSDYTSTFTDSTSRQSFAGDCIGKYDYTTLTNYNVKCGAFHNVPVTASGYAAF